ncbi:response regulator transcription factor [Collimonas silvisoli]|uniref:response regulator transcription factor n=1 Tax=Collimonas silvisoli TaxID=2825884 RepID=UPI001B8C23B9|nr:response regulator transcription factor [Collimonas silvisoli]
MDIPIKDNCSSKARIVVMDADDAFRNAIVAGLLQQRCEVSGVHDSAALYRELIERSVDIVILDADSADGSGLAIASQLRAMQRTCRLGIVMLASQDNMHMCVEGLQCGADMFLAKQSDHQEIQANIHSLHRRLILSLPPQQRTPWRFSRSEWKLFAPSGAEILLTHLETLLIDILADSRGQPVRRKDIISTALDQNPLVYDERRLEAVVSRLRKKITKIYRASQPIKVAHSIGYIFAESIERA